MSHISCLSYCIAETHKYILFAWDEAICTPYIVTIQRASNDISVLAPVDIVKDEPNASSRGKHVQIVILYTDSPRPDPLILLSVRHSVVGLALYRSITIHGMQTPPFIDTPQRPD